MSALAGLTCPECGSHDVDGTIHPRTRRSGHRCNSCGYDGTGSMIDLGGGMVVPLSELMEDDE